ncbi:MAG: colicin uptake protein, partial [Planctomycetaceae bacterium]
MKLCWAALLLAMIPAAASADEAFETYRRAVKPVLQRRCYSCHGALQQKAGLRLDTAKAILAGGDSGPGVVANDPAASLLIEKVTESDAALRMPPEGEPLTADEISALRAWIVAGAPASDTEQSQKDPRDHWAYRPPVRPQLPPGTAADASPIDAFLDFARTARGLTASPPVSKELWLRRVTLDLTG